MAKIGINQNFSNGFNQIKLVTGRKIINKTPVDYFQFTEINSNGQIVRGFGYQGSNFKKEFALALQKVKNCIGLK